jgi:hypothetical protein
MPPILTPVHHELIIKKSRFIACVQPMADRAGAQKVVARLRAEHPGRRARLLGVAGGRAVGRGRRRRAERHRRPADAGRAAPPGPGRRAGDRGALLRRRQAGRGRPGACLYRQRGPGPAESAKRSPSSASACCAAPRPTRSKAWCGASWSWPAPRWSSRASQDAVSFAFHYAGRQGRGARRSPERGGQWPHPGSRDDLDPRKRGDDVSLDTAIM